MGPRTPAQNGQRRWRLAYPTSLSPSVVHITSIVEAPFVDGRGRTGMREEISNGSGWVWDEDGHIVTNEHVIRGAKSIEVQLETGDIRRATVQAAIRPPTLPSWLSTAVDCSPPSGPLKLPPAGTTIFAFGSPLELKFSCFQWHCERLGAHGGYSKWGHPNVRRLLADRCPD